MSLQACDLSNATPGFTWSNVTYNKKHTEGEVKPQLSVSK